MRIKTEKGKGRKEYKELIKKLYQKKRKMKGNDKGNETKSKFYLE